MRRRDNDDEAGSIWTDIQEAAHWKPILPLLKRVRESRGAAKAEAVRDVAAFVLRNLSIDPWGSQAFRLFSLVVDLSRNDERVLAAINELLPLD